MPLLSHAEILRLHASILSIGVDRDALLGGLDPTFVAGLSVAKDPSGQILRDLHELNRVDRLTDGIVPLQTWLEAAVELAGPRVEAAVFREALAALAGPRNSRRSTPRYQDDTTRALSERLEDARERKRALKEARASTAEVEEEILSLRRQIREGGQLRAGDALGDGRYLLLDRIGRGGFAVVWRALDRERDEEVAVKVLHGELAGDAIRRERFHRGARIMADLAHDAVVRVLESHGEDGGYHYFVMDLIAGGDLRRAVVEGRVAGEAVLPIVIQVGDALAMAHTKGYVHRDVKPANILLDDAGAPKLTDFDLAGGKDTTGGTRTSAMGTIVYAAPELLHRPQDADARADVYGLGMTAVFGLHGGDLSLDAVRDARELIEQLPTRDAVKDVLKRAIAWRSGDRHADATAFCEALRKAMAAAPAPLPDEAATPSTGGAWVTPVKLDPGTMLANRYRVIGPLGPWRTSAVFAAENTRTGRRVAVKLLRADAGKEVSVVARLWREARAVAAITSDHVTQVLDVDEDEKRGVILIFELLEGESLLDRLKRAGPIPFEELHPIMEQVWLGLIDAHEIGIIHRDLKPSNVFLARRPDGTTQAKILDFGLSKLPKKIGGSESLTEDGQSLGTFAFMPPEQIGKAKLVDQRADIYACTTVIYQALAGQLPYPARNLLVLMELKQNTNARTLADAMGSPVDPRLEAFVAQGLMRDPDKRFPTAQEALAAWRALRPDQRSPSGWPASSSSQPAPLSSPPKPAEQPPARIEVEAISRPADGTDPPAPPEQPGLTAEPAFFKSMLNEPKKSAPRIFLLGLVVLLVLLGGVAAMMAGRLP